MDKHIRKLIDLMDCNLPAAEEELEKAEAKLGMRFPVQYKEFMRYSNGALGSIGNSYLQIWSIEQVHRLNESSATDETLCLNNESQPVICFAADGGGTYYAFDKRTEDSSIISFPAISIISEEYELCGNTFNEFLQYLYDAE